MAASWASRTPISSFFLFPRVWFLASGLLHVLDTCWSSILGSKIEEEGKEKDISVRHLPIRELPEVPYNTSTSFLPELSHMVTSNLMGE